MHWTRENEEALVNSLAMDLTSIVEEALDQGRLSRAQLRKALNVTNGRISQILSAPGNLTLRTMVRLARACGKDITVVPYEYQGDDSGPIHPQVFYASWEAAGKPAMMWQVDSVRARVPGGPIPEDDVWACRVIPLAPVADRPKSLTEKWVYPNKGDSKVGHESLAKRNDSAESSTFGMAS